jgi:hypothetical protein
MPFIAVVYLKDEEEAAAYMDEDAIGRLVGMYRFPKRDVKLCRGFTGGCRHQSWTRHKWGHWVHACGLRTPDWWKRIGMSLIDSFGINLLRRDHTPRVFQNPEQWQGPIDLGAFGTIPEFLKAD